MSLIEGVIYCAHVVLARRSLLLLEVIATFLGFHKLLMAQVWPHRNFIWGSRDWLHGHWSHWYLKSCEYAEVQTGFEQSHCSWSMTSVTCNSQIKSKINITLKITAYRFEFYKYFKKFQYLQRLSGGHCVSTIWTNSALARIFRIFQCTSTLNVFQQGLIPRSSTKPQLRETCIFSNMPC